MWKLSSRRLLPLGDRPVQISGKGRYGVLFVRLVLSGAPGGWSAVELAYLFPTAAERNTYMRNLKRRYGSRRWDAPIIQSFEFESEVTS